MTRILSITDTLSYGDSQTLLFGEQDDLSLEHIWYAALRRKCPIRSHAVAMNLELPECSKEKWELAFPFCFLCGGREGDAELFRLDTHHIQRRTSCHPAHRDWIENLFRVHRRCHDVVHGWSLARQLAMKWNHDCCGHKTLEEFLARWLRVGDPELKAPRRVTVSEINEQRNWNGVEHVGIEA